jgi:NADPH-dependent ferric siderophore reductase
MPDQPRTCRATATVDFPRIAEFLDPILASIATHDMAIQHAGDHYRVVSPFGHGCLRAEAGRLHLSVETENAPALNRIKHALVGPILFIAASERLEIRWQGDTAGLAALDDLRVLRVAQIRELTPGMRRIVFRGNDLGRFDRPDQMHCRLILQPAGAQAPEWPMLDDCGHVVWPAGRKLDTRVFTIRRIDAQKGEIVIDFFLHDEPGPATAWVLAATPGDVIGIVGPAAGGAKPAEFHVLAGDETGLPGIARILEAMDPDAQGIAFIEVGTRAEEQPLRHPPEVALHWLHRDGSAPGTTSLLIKAVRSVRWPDDLGRAFFWGGCEHRAFRDIHRYLRDELHLPRDRQVLYSHWHRSLSEEQIIEIGGAAYLPEQVAAPDRETEG